MTKKYMGHATELIFILDKSASMEGLERDAIGGFNSMVKKQKEQGGEVNITTILFDDNIMELYFKNDINDVCKLTEREYFAGGCTALLDAMGNTIHKAIQSEKERKKKAEKVIFVIITDGLENASCEYTYDSVKTLIHRQKKMGWDFLFLGANMDAVSEAANLGISENRSASFCNDSMGIALNYKVIGETISFIRMNPLTAIMDGSWKKEIVDDYKRRNLLW